MLQKILALRHEGDQQKPVVWKSGEVLASGIELPKATRSKKLRT